MIKKYLLLLVFILTGINFGYANARSVDETEKKLNQQLAAAHSPKDSIKILYNLFDLVPRKEKVKYSTVLYKLAERQQRYDIQLDLLRQMSQLPGMFNNTDSLFIVLNEEVARIPRSREQEETAIFIRIRQVAGESLTADQKNV